MAKYLLCLLLLTGATIFTTDSYGQFRSKNSGPWGSASTWEYVLLGSWVAAVAPPNSLSGDIFIQAGHTVTVNSARSISRTYINGTLEIQTGGALTIATVLVLPGELVVNAGGVLKSNGSNNYSSEIIYGLGGQLKVLSNGKISVGTGGAVSGAGLHGYATNTSNTWESGAKFEWNSITALPLSGLTYFPGVSATEKPLLIVSNSAASISVASAATINGILEVDNAISLSGAGSKTFRDGITGSGTLTVEAGSGAVNLTGTAPVLGGRNLQVVTDSYFYIPNGLTIPADSSVSVATNTGASFIGKGTNNFVVNGSITMGTVTIENPSGAVVVNGVLKTGHTGGLEGGTITNASTVQVNTGSTIEYNGDVNQVVTSTNILEGSAPYYNIIFSGSGTKTLANNIAISNHVRITNTAIVEALSYSLGSASAAFTMEGGRLHIGSGGLQPIMAGTYNLTGGTIQFARNGSPQLIRSGTSFKYHFIDVAGDQVSGNPGTDIHLVAGGYFTIKSTGTFISDSNSVLGITGAQSFVMENGAKLYCTNASGFNGPYLGVHSAFVGNNIETVNLVAGSTIYYSRSSGDGAQTITNTVPYQHLVIAGTGNKRAPKGLLSVRGNFTKTGTSVFDHNNGSMIFNGANGQVFSNTSSFPLYFNDVTNSSAGLGLTINSDSMGIERELTLSAGSKLKFGTGNIILKSGALNTARVSSVPAEAGIISYTGTGRFIVERYMPAIKAWRFLATPVKTGAGISPSISEAWRESGSMISTGYGTQVTGPAGSVGMDAVSAAASVKWYNMATNNYVPVTNSNDLLANNTGYMVFVRGDRAVNPSGAGAVTNLRMKGQLRTGDQSFVVNANSSQSIGNPYASAFSFADLLTATAGLGSYYIAWDPSLNGSYGAGGFQTFSALDGFKANAASAGSAIFTVDQLYPNIQSGQAFYVYNPTGSAVNITITEAMKKNGSRIAGRENTIEDRSFIRTKLLTGSGEMADASLLAFDDEFTNDLNEDDAVKFTNAGENFCMMRSGKKLSVEARERLKAGDSIFYNMSNLRQQAYKLLIEPENLAGTLLEAWFIDQYSNSRTLLNLRRGNEIDFVVNAAAGSRAANRFLIVFKSITTVLPVTLVSVKATQVGKAVAVKWVVENEIDIDYFELQRSANGKDFYDIGRQIGARKTVYTGHDEHAGTVNFYRVKAVGINGSIQYSQIEKLVLKETVPAISVFPNPVVNKLMQVHFTNQNPGDYVVELTAPDGKLVYTERVAVNSDNFISKLHLPKGLVAGNYNASVRQVAGQVQTIPVVVF